MDLVELTANHLPLGRIEWLEVGAGDGRNLQFQLEKLSPGRTLIVTALEPAAIRPAMSSEINWLTTKSEDYQNDRPFDWISVRHSAYYIAEPAAELARLVNMLGDGGALALTHWSSNCILRRLHVALCGDRSNVACDGVEKIAALLHRDRRIEVAALSFHDTELDVDRVLADPDLGGALYELARRGHAADQAAAADPFGTIARLLRGLPNPRQRRNGILILRRRKH